MSFRDHFFPSTTPLFPTAAQVQTYLVAYAQIFGLRPYINFGTAVTRLHKDGEEWVVESTGKDGETVGRYDRVVVANGHYEQVHVPEIPGIS